MTIQVDKTQWPKVKMQMKAAWKNLQDDELDQTDGDIEEISKMLQKKYGGNPELILNRVARILNLRNLDEAGHLQVEAGHLQVEEPHNWYGETKIF